MFRASKGFSLVELSIVLVILGLLAGGILAGKSLIRASELRSVSTEYSRWVAASGSFRDKYFGMPGDLTNATSFWGRRSGCAGTDDDGVSTTATCDGNGDGIIYAPLDLSRRVNEQFLFWQQMALAGIIEGQYTGTCRNCNGVLWGRDGGNPGVNIPRTKLSSSAGWLVMLDSATNNVANLGGRTVYLLGNCTSAGSYFCFNPALKPEEAWNIDTKMDDGKPGTGTINAASDGGTGLGGSGCHSSGATFPVPKTATYSLDSTDLGCALVFRLN